MSKNTITPTEYAELKTLIEEHARAQRHAADVLHKYGMESAEFAAADKASGAIFRRIRALQGMAGKPWNA